MEQLLGLLVELVGLLLAQIVDPRLVLGELGMLAGLGQRRVFQAVELEAEEDQVRRDVGQPLLHVAVELAVGLVGRIAGIEQLRIGREPAEQVFQRLVVAHAGGQRRAILHQPRELALIARLEGASVLDGLLDVALERRGVYAGIEVFQIPLGHRAEGSGRSAGYTSGWCGRGDLGDGGSWERSRHQAS